MPTQVDLMTHASADNGIDCGAGFNRPLSPIDLFQVNRRNRLSMNTKPREFELQVYSKRS